MHPQLRLLIDAAACPYGVAGKYAKHFARGKLRHDPVFFFLLRHGLLPDRGSLLDLGCGQGILLSLLKAAKDQYLAGRWPQDWPAPPLNLGLRGVELREDRAQAAQRALGAGAPVETGDLRELAFPSCSVIVLLDVLLYLDAAVQMRVIAQAAAALEPGGLLLLREADAGAGLAFRMTQWGEWIAGALRGEFAQQVHYRRTAQWVAALAAHRFEVRTEPMSAGTPFANVLFVARKAPQPA